MPLTDDVLEKKMGRPVLYDKPLKRTFMLSEKADAILDKKRVEMGCSRSDVLVHAILALDRRTSKTTP